MNAVCHVICCARIDDPRIQNLGERMKNCYENTFWANKEDEQIWVKFFKVAQVALW